MSNAELGKEILSKLEYKDNSKGKNSKKDFWTVTGIKSYNTFSKKYKLVEGDQTLDVFLDKINYKSAELVEK